MAATAVGKIRGMQVELRDKLLAEGIRSSETLLKTGCSPEARVAFAKRLGVDPKTLLELLNRADLDRIPGIGAVYSDLLEQVGVDTVKELSRRVPAHLYATIVQKNLELKLTLRPPTEKQVESWVEAAKHLPTMLEY